MAYPQPSMTPVINADEATRSRFLVQVYQHLALAIAAFVAIEAMLFQTGAAEAIYDFILRVGGIGWLALLGGIMIVQAIAGRSAHQLGNTRAQYLALFAVAGTQAVIFAPLLHYIYRISNQGGSVISAAVVTGIGFAALTVVAMTTRKDLSFLRPIVTWGFVVALGLIVASIFLGFSLGSLFAVAMIGLAGASILYQTQQIVRTYPEWAYVGAAVGLFVSVMLLFWYVLQLFTRR